MATTLAKAYVQIVPTTQGIQANLQKEMNGVGSSVGSATGSKMGASMSGGIKAGILAAVAAAGTAVVSVFKQSIDEGAALEQSLGGVETLFKDSANAVVANARQAFSSAGVSANAYMEMVTGFSASLLQSLGGDTQRAAEIADMAIRDMSDNANKFGSEVSALQTAYQGFARQNYTINLMSAA